jgi:hypothetical protein
MIEVVDYLDVRARAAELDLELAGEVTFLPRGFETAADSSDLVNESDALDLAKLLRARGAAADVARLSSAKLPTIAENSAFVHLPDILVTAANGAVMPLLIGVVANFVYDRLVGTFRKPQIRVRVVGRSADGTYKAITYEGPVEGLETLRDAVEEVTRHD